MAIERRAIFALSIAFTAAIVAYPDLPPDIPPQAGRHGAFIGAPFVAFLLPVAALVIWWIVASLSQRSSDGAPHAHGAGAATALFLSAFHVIMLIGFIGGQLWLGRILGVMVGVFLMATGNELPRVRPNPTWGIWGVRTRQTLTSDDVWRRVHRLGGFIRVLMGVVVCVAALWGMRGLAEVIALAVCVEVAVCVGAALFLSRQKGAVVGVVLLGCCGIAMGAEAQRIQPEKIEGLPAFIDATVPKLMEQGHVPGVAVAVVHEGRIVMLRGYGQARLDSGARVDASRTLFRIGSVSKVLTAAAAVQLADRGMLDLQRDIRAYVPDFPLRYGATTHQLLTHTAGLDERSASAPMQVFRPGTAYSYSNSNYSLAGLVIERVSGLAFETYMADRLFRPLRMTTTTARQPPEPNLLNDLARGYHWTGGSHEPLPYRFGDGPPEGIGHIPAGGISTTAADMGRFMLALLGDGSVDGGRILSPEFAKMVFAPQYTANPRIPPRAYASLYWFTHGLRLLHHDGSLGDQIGVLVLAPDDRFGIFVASNSPDDGSQVGNLILDPLLTHLVGPSAPTPPPPAPLPDALLRARRFAGTYRDYRHHRHDMSRIWALMPMIQSRVTVEPDGAIHWKGHRWLEVEPMVFRSLDRPDYNADRPDYIVFREIGTGDVTELQAWGATYERVGWREQAIFHLGLLASCVIAFLAYGLSRGLRALRHRMAPDEGRLARRCAIFVALANLIFVGGLVVFFRGLGTASKPFSLPVVLWLSLPLVSVVVTALLPGFAATAWRDVWWTRRERLVFSAFAALSVAFMTFLNYWKLLGIRY
jgi:CubicO group peptidase (beta-lactamase class C family)